MTESIFDTLDVYLDGSSGSAALNMAIDETLLEIATVPAIRLYRWDHPAVSFGYFGRSEEAAKIAEGRDLVRRWTGGGIVLHGTDLTYSIALPSTGQYSLRSHIDLYSAVHSAMRDVLVRDGLPAMLANFAPEKISDACFANPVRWDVMLDSQKIAGAAQRRTRAGLLQQGSIQYEMLPKGFAERFARALCPSARTRSFTNEMLHRAQEIAQQKYVQRSWLERR
jgi:lipoyl(octanoyl) transferase